MQFKLTIVTVVCISCLGHHVPSTLPWSDQEGKTRATNVGPSVTYHDVFLCVINGIYSYM